MLIVTINIKGHWALKKIGQFIGILVMFLMGLAVGIVLPRLDTQSAAAQDVQSRYPLLDEATDFVEQNFVGESPDETTIEYALIRAYLATLNDSNTFFIEPAVAASESQSLAGRYGGIGVDIQRNEAGEFVLYPFDPSPAREAGLRDGDILLAVNGERLGLDSTMDEVRQAVRGEIVDGAGVDLVVRNQADAIDAEREYFILFDEILVPSITWRTLFEAPEIGYISIARFTSRTPEEFAQAVNELKLQDVEAIVLDLRQNSGGLLQESIDIAGEFFDGGVLSIEERVTGERIKEDIEGGLLVDLPIAVLVDGRTASASEIVAGAIQARERGVLIGQPTFGKGSIQSIFPLSDSSSIHVTVALWYTPDGGELDAVGLTPDIQMIPDENGRDVELGEAVRYLRNVIAEDE